MARRQQRRGRQQPDWAWIDERLLAYCRREGLMKSDGQPNWAALGRRLGGSNAMVAGWVNDRKWPDADNVLAIADVLQESKTTWLTKAGFLLDVPVSNLSAAMEMVVRVMGQYTPEQQECLLRLVETAHRLVDDVCPEERDDEPGGQAPDEHMHARTQGGGASGSGAVSMLSVRSR